jgi:hypothetical protein
MHKKIINVYIKIKPQGKRPLGRLCIEWRIILKLIIEKVRIGLKWLKIGYNYGLL